MSLRTTVARCALLLSAFAAPAFAQTHQPGVTPNAGDATVLDDIQVIGNDDTPLNPIRLPKSARVSSQTFTAEDVIRLQPRDTFELLNYGTGVFATTTGKKAPANLNVRGDGSYAFMIDGAYYPAFLASRVLASIPTMAIEEARIVRTSTALTISPLVGLVSPSGAPNNGFMVVRTRQPDEAGGVLRAYVGSDGSLAGGILGGSTFDLGRGHGYVSGLAHTSRTDGPNGFNLDRSSSSLLLRAGFADERMRIDFTALHDDTAFGFQRSTDVLQDSTYNARWRMDPQKTLTLAASGAFRWNEVHTTLASIGHTDSRGDYVQESYVAPTVTRLDNDNEILNAGLRHNIFMGGTRLQFGADYIRWHTPSGQFYYEGVEREEEVRGLFIQADQALFDGRLNLDLGLRRDQVTLVTGIDYYNPGRQPTNPAIIKDRDLPAAEFVSAGASFRVADGWLVNLRYGHSTQGARSGVTPYPGVVLEGEAREKFEIGFEGTVTPLFSPSLNYFQIDTENEAAPRDYVMIDGVQIARYDNTDSKRTGAELVFSGAWGGQGREGGYRFGVTHFFDVLDPSGLLAKTQPKTVAELILSQDWGDWRFGAAAKYVSEYTSNAFARCATPTGVCPMGVSAPYLPIGDYVRTDLTVSRRMTLAGRDVRASFSLRNAGDARYQTSLGYPDGGRSLGLELLAEF